MSSTRPVLLTLLVMVVLATASAHDTATSNDNALAAQASPAGLSACGSNFAASSSVTLTAGQSYIIALANANRTAAATNLNVNFQTTTGLSGFIVYSHAEAGDYGDSSGDLPGRIVVGYTEAGTHALVISKTNVTMAGAAGQGFWTYVHFVPKVTAAFRLNTPLSGYGWTLSGMTGHIGNFTATCSSTRVLGMVFDGGASVATAPAEPELSSLWESCEGVHIYWSAGDDGGSPILSYSIRRHVDGEASELVATLDASARDWLDAVGNMSAGTTYFYHVNATNAVGTSDPLTVNGRAEGYCVSMPIFGEDGAIYGGHIGPDGNYTGGRAALATSMGVSETSVSMLYGLLWIVGFTVTGFTGARLHPLSADYAGIGAAVGAFAGVAMAIAFGFVEVWVVVFVLVLGAAIFALVKMRRGG